MIRRLLLEGIGHAQDSFLIEWLADDLQTDRQPRRVKPARNGDPRDAGEVDGNGKDVGEIHLQGIVDLFPNLEGRCRRNWSDEHIDTSESLLKIPPDQRPDLLRLSIIGLIVASAKGIGAEHDAALDLGAKALV